MPSDIVQAATILGVALVGASAVHAFGMVHAAKAATREQPPRRPEVAAKSDFGSSSEEVEDRPQSGLEVIAIGIKTGMLGAIGASNSSRRRKPKANEMQHFVQGENI